MQYVASALGLDHADLEALQTVYTVSDYYHLDEATRYEIELMRPWVSVLGRDRAEKVELACNPVTLEITRPEPEPPPIDQEKQSGKFRDCDASQQSALLRAEAVTKWILPIALGSHTYGRTQVASDSKYYEE